MLRTCKECGLVATTEDDLTQFVKDEQSRYNRRNICRPCWSKRTDNSSQQMKDWKTDYQVNKRYGITRAVYLERMATSDCCGICGHVGNLCYDHDHNTMKFRGVLCRSCNRSLGQLGDTIEDVRNVLAYLS